jgi:MFS family permease
LSETIVETAVAAETRTDRVPLWRIGVGLSIVNVTTYLAIFAVMNVLLPSQIIGVVGDAGKEVALGVITTLGAIVSMISSPLIGAFSDRTRSRLGRRAIWILGGGALTLVSLNLIGIGGTLVILGLGWILTQLAVNSMIMPFQTALPERVPQHRRGLLSGVVGLAMVVAISGAAILGAQFVTMPLTGTLLLSVLALAGAIAYVLFAPEHSSKTLDTDADAAPRPPILRSMLDSLRTSPDFRWTLISRFLVVLGYNLLAARMLYFVQAQFVGDLAAAATAVGSLAAVGGLFMTLGLVVSAPLSDKLGRKPFLIVAGIVIGLAMFGLATVGSMTGLMVAYSVMSLAFGTFMGVDQALVADVLPSTEDAAKDLGVINFSATLPQTLAPAIGSVILIASGGSYPVLLVVGGLIAISSAVATFKIKGVR